MGGVDKESENVLERGDPTSFAGFRSGNVFTRKTEIAGTGLCLFLLDVNIR